MPRVLSSRDLAVWAACFLAAAALVVLTRFTSVDGDSALYAGLAGRLVQEPMSRWIAPEWWGFWNGHGLFLEHPAGLLLLPALAGRLGVPAVQAAYVQGLAAVAGSLLLIGLLVARVTTAVEGRAAIALLQVMPAAFIFRIRSNHEYPMLFCLALTLVALDNTRGHRAWAAVVALALSAALVVKGVFVVLILIAAGLWILFDPAARGGSRTRPVIALALGLAAMAGVVAGYDAWYRRVTGTTFWGPYWRRQLGPVTISTPMTGAATAVQHLGFYVLRLLWHPAPWTAAILLVAWRHRRHLAGWLRAARPIREQRALAFVAVFVASVIGLLFPLSRFAERYAFSATFAAGAVGAVIAVRTWPALRRLDRLWATSGAPAAALWLGLIVLRLALGPFLPRLQ